MKDEFEEERLKGELGDPGKKSRGPEIRAAGVARRQWIFELLVGGMDRI